VFDKEARKAGIRVWIGGITEVLLDEQTGILTTPGDTEELIKAIERLVWDRDLKNYFSDMAREHVENHFDVKMQVSKTVELYQQRLR
jgi:glycosyltransferase involved in cell wall biosynthesis